VRLMFLPRHDWGQANANSIPRPSEAQLAFSNHEKAYYYPTLTTGTVDNAPMPSYVDETGADVPSDGRRHYAFPLVSFERDVIDKKLMDIDWEDPFLGEDIRCYLDNLVAQPEMKLLFEYIFPIRRVPSLVSSYIYSGWFASIGADESERDGGASSLEFDEEDVWREGTFDETKEVVYKMFRSYYNTDSWDFEWDWDWDPNWRLWFSDLFPRIFTNLDGSTTWWQKWRVQKDRPFDKDGNQCRGPYGKFFNFG
jgi:hypothetical protein